MPALRKLDDMALLDLLRRLHDEGGVGEASSSQLAALSGAAPMTVKRALQRLWLAGRVMRTGRARATRYRLANAQRGTHDPHVLVVREPGPLVPSTLSAPSIPSAPSNRSAPSDASLEASPADGSRSKLAGPNWSDSARTLQAALRAPLGVRRPVTYARGFVDDYIPNRSALLPEDLGRELARIGGMAGRLPAGTYARKVLEQLLIDLSWSSSRLEGNRYTRLDTEALFRDGLGGADRDAVMLLNHKNAIEFLVDAVPHQGLTLGVVRNLHALLMQDLLEDSDSLGAIRQRLVNITDTVYLPTQVPSLLLEMLTLILEKAQLIKNPAEAAFFLWVNIAYLQPFEDGNKRTSRLAANIPLMLYNNAPLSFLDVDQHDYADAMIAVYELRDVTLAVELFAWTYRRACEKYAVILESMGLPDPQRLRYREMLNAAMGLIVRDGQRLESALTALQLDETRAPGFARLLQDELRMLEPYNCARYRLTMHATQDWIAAGRPS